MIYESARSVISCDRFNDRIRIIITRDHTFCDAL